MALKIHHSKVRPEPPPPQIIINNKKLGDINIEVGGEEESSKNRIWLCKKKSKRKSEKEGDDDFESRKKPKSFRSKLKDKSGGIYLVIHQSICLILFFSIETKNYFASLSFPELLIPAGAGFLLVLSLIFMLITILMDPGVQPRKSPEHQQLEINYYNTHRISPVPVLRPMVYYGKTILGNYCFECKHFKHLRTVHCKFCDRCIIRFDHHCNVLGTCVGIRNFPFYFYLMSTIFIYYLYMTVISVLVLARNMVEDKPTVYQVLQNVSILWIVIISLVIMIVSDVGHLILFPCVYCYITALDKTARELFFVIETGGQNHYKCYRVLKTMQDGTIMNGGSGALCNCCQIMKNLCHYLCTGTPPSLLKESNYYVVCDLDEVLARDKKDAAAAAANILHEKIFRACKSEFDLRFLSNVDDNGQVVYRVPEERTKSCCKF